MYGRLEGRINNKILSVVTGLSLKPWNQNTDGKDKLYISIEHSVHLKENFKKLDFHSGWLNWNFYFRGTKTRHPEILENKLLRRLKD